jgi:hypothetical protein
MKIAKFVAIVSAALVLGVAVQAAPVDSVESSRAAALSKVDSFLAEKAVAKRLTAAGLSAEQARARLAKLSDAQLEQLAAQVDQIHAGGMIQDSGTTWAAQCFFKNLETFFANIFRILFCWPDLK